MTYDFPRDAACHPRNGYDGDLDIFFPVGVPGAGPYDAQVEQAKAVCAVCPVRDACLADALDAGIEHGVFGGYDAPERDALRATPEAVLLARHAATAQAHADEMARRRDAQMRALARPTGVGRADPRKRGRPRMKGYCPACDTYQWLRLRTGGVGGHSNTFGQPCPGVGKPPNPNRTIYTEVRR